MRIARKNLIPLLIVLALILAGVGYFGMKKGPDPAAKQARNPAQIVKTGTAEKRAMPIVAEANGYVTAFNTVEVRPQSQNIVRQVHVREGQDVEAGQLLFTLDQRTENALVERARAQVAKDRADLVEAEATLKRNEELVARGFVSQAVLDTARSRVAALRGTLQADQASAQASAVALDNNRITASFAGRIGAITVHPGSLAQPAGNPMVTISQIDPITVTFSVPERELGFIRTSYPQGDAPVTALLADGRAVEGKLVFIDNASDIQSGTIRMKAKFANPERLMWPGSFVNVRMVTRTIPDAVVVPAQAVVTGPVDKFVYVVQQDETVKQQRVEVLNIENGKAAITGVTPGARIVIEGTQNLRPGGKVREMQAPNVAQAGGQANGGQEGIAGRPSPK